MRLTFSIASANERWCPIIPRIDREACFPMIDGEAAFDEAEFRREIKNSDAVQLNGDESEPALVAGALLLAYLRDFIMDNDRSGSLGGEAVKVHSRIDRRLDRGQVTKCRVDISGVIVEKNGRHFRVPKFRIRTEDFGVVETRRWEREFAYVIADYLNESSKAQQAKGSPGYVFSDETKTLIDELHERTRQIERRDRVKELNGNRLFCPNHVNGYCSPSKIECECYCGGRCVEVKE